jgi:phosphoglycolate phosphatase-like HAD superfamily hydrolase
MASTTVTDATNIVFLFDLDGTLLDTEPVYFRAYQKAALG